MGQITGPDVDSGYAWVIVFASFALHFQQVNTCVAVFLLIIYRLDLMKEYLEDIRR